MAEMKGLRATFVHYRRSRGYIVESVEGYSSEDGRVGQSQVNVWAQ